MDDFGVAQVASNTGVYLWTVEHNLGFLIYTAGITRRPFQQRFREHTRAYQSGVYTVFDAADLARGERNKIWPGFWFRRRTPQLKAEYQRRASEIGDALEKLLSAYRVFVAPVSTTPRVLERIEAAIMNALYAAKGIPSIIPDRGMSLSPRWEQEPVLMVRSIIGFPLHGLPSEFEA
ncbi:MAG: hypothetical protein HC853_19045 [Anaerolineae bacterium]|nr:hypothetical protein [Anaerolineae bacterium]